MIELQKAREFVTEVEQLAERLLPSPLAKPVRDWAKSHVLGQALEELRKLVFESRPPVIFLLGRSGHGKSSLINALCGWPVAAVGDIKPHTAGSHSYRVEFQEGRSVWELVDSRGLFESTGPGGGPACDVVALTIESLREHKPDVIMHVVSLPEVRALSEDMAACERIHAAAAAQAGHPIPAAMVLTKADTLGNPRHWPPAEHPEKATQVTQAVCYLTSEVLGVRLPEAEPLVAGAPLHGYRLPGHARCKAVVPVCALPDPADQWNVAVLQEFLGGELPEDCQLHYYQALGRRDLLRRVAARLTRRFAEIAGGVGASPLPVADILVLSPLQLLLVVMIGGLSCRPMSRATFREYLGAMGGTGVAGLGLRAAAQQLVKLVPVPLLAQTISGGIAAGGTYAIGRSAEAYFFGGQVRPPAEFLPAADALPPAAEADLP